jgi:acetyl-CoA carboxylase biotin carboxylase subunit
MVRAIDDFSITGVITTLPFGKFVMENEHFKSGNFDTHFVKNHFDSDFLDLTNEKEAKIAGLLAKHLVESNSHAIVSNGQLSNKSNWKKNRA